MTLPDVHLAGEAVAAYVDDALSPTARERAHRHLRSCDECRAVINAQREAKVLLAASFDPELPAGLLARLRDIPMTADLGGSDLSMAGAVLAVEGGAIGWARTPAPPDFSGEAELAAVSAAGVALAVGGRSSGGSGSSGGWHRLGAVLGRVTADAAGSRPVAVGRRDTAERGGRPDSHPGGRSARRRRNRRLAGALAGLAFGVIASAASAGGAGGALPAGSGGASTADTTRLVVNRGPSSTGSLDASPLQIRVPSQRRAPMLTVVGSPR